MSFLRACSSVRRPDGVGTKPSAAGRKAGTALICRGGNRGASPLTGSSCQWKEESRAEQGGPAALPRRGLSRSTRNGGQALPPPRREFAWGTWKGIQCLLQLTPEGKGLRIGVGGQSAQCPSSSLSGQQGPTGIPLCLPHIHLYSPYFI